MLKRPIVVAFSALLAALAVAGCGKGPASVSTSESPANAAAPTAEKAAGDTDRGSAAPAQPETVDLEVEQGMTSALDTIGNRYTSVGAVLTNPNTEAAYGVQVVFNLKDAAGSVIDTQNERIDYVAAGGKRLVAPAFIGFNTPTEPTSVEVVTVVEAFAEDKGPAGSPAVLSVPQTELTVVAAAIQGNQYATKVAGQLSNPGAEVAEFSTVHCVLRAGGILVGGVFGGVGAPLVPGGTVAFDALVSTLPAGADAVECQAFS